MGLVRRLALIVLLISLLTFIALFGALPRLRKTPVGTAYRFLRYTFPSLLAALDRRLTGGTFKPLLLRCGDYIVNEPHPLILVFYLILVTGGIYVFLASAWLFLSPSQRFFVAAIVPLPYLTLYLSAFTNPGIVTPNNHVQATRMYPPDYANFFPNNLCRTCHLSKPARSKHCRLCKACVARMDHHCAWINNCVGVNNSHYFLSFLFSTCLLLWAGVWLCHDALIKVLWRNGLLMDKIKGWERFMLLGLAVAEEVYLGAVFLICILTGLLAIGFTAYHCYLVWAGTTTNETEKWSEWRECINDGLVFKADLGEEEDEEGGVADWPRKQTEMLFRIDTPGRTEELPRGIIWRRVQSLAEVENIYDIGGWENLMDVVRPRTLR